MSSAPGTVQSTSPCWFYAANGQVQLLDEAKKVVAYTWYSCHWWQCQVVGRRDPEPPQLSPDAAQEYLERETGLRPERR